jgi:pyruvate/2-oxoglutarate dehydrogenase complex dihydrolipoamide acyltransferase (E2) component
MENTDIGDEVKKDETVMELVQDKAPVSIPSPFDGYVVEISSPLLSSYS